MAFCTLEQIEAFLQIDVPSGRYGAIERAIDEATAAIQDYTGQTLDQVDDDEVTLDCVGGTRILLPELPVISVSSVIEDDEALDEDDDWKLGQHGILHRIGGPWAAGVQIITVTYSHGYDSDSIPQLIQDVATRAAARAYQAGVRAAEVGAVPGVNAVSLGDYSVSFGSEQSVGAGEAVLGASAAPILLRSEKERLNRWRVKP